MLGPPTTTWWLVEPVDEGAAELAVEETAAVEDAAAVVELAVALPALTPVAAVWNAAKLLPGLIAKTIPCWQWLA